MIFQYCLFFLAGLLSGHIMAMLPKMITWTVHTATCGKYSEKDEADLSITDKILILTLIVLAAGMSVIVVHFPALLLCFIYRLPSAHDYSVWAGGVLIMLLWKTALAYIATR
jgi:hypothetical protein